MIRQLPDGHALVIRGSLLARHRPARRRLERPRLQGSPPRWHRHRPAARRTRGSPATGTSYAAGRRLARRARTWTPKPAGDGRGDDAPAYPWS